MPEQLLPPQVPWQGGCACAGTHIHEEQGWGGYSVVTTQALAHSMEAESQKEA